MLMPWREMIHGILHAADARTCSNVWNAAILGALPWSSSVIVSNDTSHTYTMTAQRVTFGTSRTLWPHQDDNHPITYLTLP
jgi:hypothetical protein